MRYVEAGLWTSTLSVGVLVQWDGTVAARGSQDVAEAVADAVAVVGPGAPAQPARRAGHNGVIHSHTFPP
jgi:hypothetical protein